MNETIEFKKTKQDTFNQIFLERNLKIFRKTFSNIYRQFRKPGSFHFVRNATVVFLIIFFVVASILNVLNVQAATYTWNQTDWAGGLSGSSYPIHPTNETGWTKYESKDSSTSVGSGSISVSSTSSSSSQTSQADFNGGTLSNVTASGGGDVALTASASGDVWSTMTSNNDTIFPTPTGGLTKGATGFLYASYRGGSLAQKFERYSTSGNTWTALTADTSPGRLVYGGGNLIYKFSVGGSGQKREYSISGNSWSNSVSAPGTLSTDGLSATYPGSGDVIYITAGSNTAFYSYSISGNSFSTLSSVPATTSTGATIVSTGGNFLYATRGGSTTNFYRYSISGNSWTSMTSVPSAVGSGGAMVYPESGDYIYVTKGGSNLYRYSISGDSWTTMTAPPGAISDNAYFAYPGSGNYFYAMAGGNPGGTFYRYAMNTTYNASGTLTSSAIDLGQQSNPSTLTWTGSTPTNTTLKFQIRSATSSGGLSSATYYGPTGTGDFYTSSGTTINAINSGYRYYQYKAYFDTTDNTVTPTLSDITLNYSYYPSSSTLTSSAFNTGDSHNVLAKVQWTATTPTNTAVKFQIRSAADSSGVPGVYTSFLGPDGTSGTYFTDSSGGESFPSALTNGSSDQWFEYKVFLTTTDNSVAPTLSDVTTTYVVNAPPDFNPDYPSTGNGGAGASENSNGTVTINYSIRDTDTSTGVTPGTILPTFEYSLDNGSNWSTISSGNLTAGNLSAQSVGASSYTVHSATWNAVANVPGTYSTQVKIRVTANDSEAANNTATATSAAFTLDTKAPTLGVVPVYVDESQSPALATLSATDDGSFQMKVGKQSDLSDATYESYSGTKTISMSPGDTIYAQFLDAYGNTSSTSYASPPSAPSNMFFQDVSNSELLDWRIFFAWSVVSDPSAGFRRYNIYRSINGGGYSLLTTVSSRATNYYVDSGLITTSEYTYKVTAEDNNGNISFFSPTISHTPNGVGGSDITPPTLSNVEYTDVTTNGATITWDTDKLSNSTVYYLASLSYPGTDKTSYTASTGVPSMVTSHSVIMSNLSTGTKYYFLVESTDASNNTGNSSSNLYSFTTSDGPVISNVTVPSIFDNESTVSWKTDIAGDSYVTYSVNPDMSAPTNTVGSGSRVTDHSVTISGLSSGTKYFYYVSSTDSLSNTAIDNNVIDGVVEYYNFVTTSDTSAPIISNVATSLVGENGVAISWTTDKPSLSQVEWGLTSDLGTLTTETTVYTFDHAVVITGLSDTQEYFYDVISKDRNNNSTTSDVYNFTTLAPTVVTETITNTVTVRGGGGTLDNRDLEPPVVNDVKINQIGAHSAVVTFTTSKIANGVINFGKTKEYGLTTGDTETYSTKHTIVLVGLLSNTEYHLEVDSKDVYDNEGFSADKFFSTLLGDGKDLIDLPTTKNILSPDEQAVLSKVKNASPAFVEQLLLSLSQDSNLLNVSDASLTQFVSDFASKVGASPAISGPDVVVETGPHSALIRWTTDKQSNSLVAYAKSIDYKADSENPYTISAGFPDDLITEHSVTLQNLEPNTTYHFNARSQGPIGPVSVSGDKTFQTTSLFPVINDLHFNNINETSVSLSWHTDVPTRTDITLSNTKTGEQTKSKDDSYTKDHSTVIPKLDIATAYTISIIATDSDNNDSRSSVLPFSTVLSREAPKISAVHISTSLIPDHSQSAQTIISWKTDKPATSRVFFAEGASTELAQSTPAETGLVEDHIVVTTLLKPGTAYTLKVESGDSAGNISNSGRYSILTPKLAGSVVDLIFGNLNKTFGFLKK